MVSTEPITFTPGEVAAYIDARLPELKHAGRERRGPCPVHHGKDPNFSINVETGLGTCHSQCGRGWDLIGLHMELTDSDFKTAKNEVFDIVGRSEREPKYRHNGLHANAHASGAAPSKPAKSSGAAGAWQEVERYPYRDRNGSLRYSVVRYLKPDGEKTFRQCRPDGRGGTVWNLDGVKRVPYHLPNLLADASKPVFLPEGEKDVHTLESWGLLASCNPGGADSSDLYSQWVEYFRGREIIVLPDNDPKGRKHAAAVAAILLDVAGSIHIVEFPGLPEKGDVSDWRDAGGTREKFLELVKAAPVIDAAGLEELRARWGLADEEVHQAHTEAGETKKTAREQAGDVVTRRIADIEAKPVSWLWKDRIARGKVTIIAGDPGLGKSQITASVAAVVTTGGQWPVTRERCELGDVLFLTAEDDPADTLRPRLEAAGANLARVHVIDGVIRGYTGKGDRQTRAFSLQEDLRALEAELTQRGNVAVVVIDPISAYLGGVDSHKNAEVRALLAPLGELAARHNVAIIVISHLNKAGAAQAMMRVTGSLAFVAAARAAYLVAADPADKERRLFLSIKNNLAKEPGGLAFRIEGATVASPAGPLTTSRVRWESTPVTITADEVMQSDATNGRCTAVDEATEWLRETLADGPMPSSEIFESGDAEGFSKRTLKRAARELGIKPTKAGMRGGWSWSLPKGAKSPEECQEKSLAPFGEAGTLHDGPEAEIEL